MLEQIEQATVLTEQRAGVAPLCVAEGVLARSFPLVGTPYRVRLTVGHILCLASIGSPLIPALMGQDVGDVRTQSDVVMDDVRCMWVVTRSCAEVRDVLDKGRLDAEALGMADAIPAAAWMAFGGVLQAAITAGMETAVSMEAPGGGGGGVGKRLGQDGRPSCWIALFGNGILRWMRRWRRR